MIPDGGKLIVGQGYTSNNTAVLGTRYRFN